MKKLLLLSFAFVNLSFGQLYYSVTKTTSLSSAAEVITVQQPASGAKIVRFQGVYFKCSVACTVTIENGGTAATATTLAVNPVNSTDRAATVTAFSSSDVGTGTTLKSFTLAAGDWRYMDLTGYKFDKSGTDKNLTVRTSSITGTVDISFSFTEADH